MADTTPLEKVTGWVADEADLSLDDTGRIVVGDEMRIDVEVDDERLLLSHTSIEPGASAERITELRSHLPGRATTMTGSVESVDGGATVVITNRVYLDGLNHQSFSTALRDLIGAVDAVGVKAVEPAAAPAPAPAQKPTTMEPEAPHAPEPTREMPPAWVATHVVPAGGMSAWPEPNPELEPVANLEARVRLAVAERRGDWAKVVGSNGWTGWVDARRLVAIDAAPVATPGTSSGFTIGNRTVSPVMMVGALLVGLSALLPWFSGGGPSINAMDISAKVLFDYASDGGAPYIGWVLFGIAALSLLVSFLPRPTAPAVLLGIAAIAVPVLFAAQVYRLVTDLGGSIGDLTEVIQFGPAVTFAGGIAILIGGNR